MSVFQAVLLGILYWIGEANLPFVGLWTIQRPLVCGWIAGIILGDPLKGAMVGASINLVYLGFISAGGSLTLYGFTWVINLLRMNNIINYGLLTCCYHKSCPLVFVSFQHL